jgi:hypothetical protein
MTLTEIVEQLRSCKFTCEAGALEQNIAFIALEILAENQGEIQVEIPRSGWLKKEQDVKF